MICISYCTPSMSSLPISYFLVPDKLHFFGTPVPPLPDMTRSSWKHPLTTSPRREPRNTPRDAHKTPQDTPKYYDGLCFLIDYYSPPPDAHIYYCLITGMFLPHPRTKSPKSRISPASKPSICSSRTNGCKNFTVSRECP